MFFRSLFYERTVLRHMERVEQLPAEVQAEIAKLWAAPAISEAWCNARLGLTNGNLHRHSAVAIIALETFTSNRTADRQPIA